MKASPACFGLQGNHHQGATTSTWLKIKAWFNVDTDVVSVMVSYYAAITLTTSVRRLYLH
jgi:bacillopeptidase F (M6 metalloprotease family)